MSEGRGPRGSDRIRVEVDSDIEDLVPGFLENRRADVTRIMEALERGDYETIRILGHSMKGAGGGYGFDRISEIGAELELCAKGRSVYEVERWVAELRDYLNRVEVVYVRE